MVYLIVSLDVVSFYERWLLLALKVISPKGFAGFEKCCTFALAHGEEHFTFVIVQLFQILVCRFFKGLVFIGRVAQLNRAFDYGSKGCRFESCRGHKKSLPRGKALFACIGLM